MRGDKKISQNDPNHLAHSQDIASQDWPLIAGITQRLESLVSW